MRLIDLEHIIRAAADATNEYEIVVVGSQSILGSVPNPPAACTFSMEADVFPLNAESKWNIIDGVLGEGSPFHDMNGYYAQGVDTTTSTLPGQWRARLVRVQSANTNGRVGYCLDPTDLFLAKCAAARPKDLVFNTAMLGADIVSLEVALARIPEMPVDAQQKHDIEMFARRAYASAHPMASPSLGASILSSATPTLKSTTAKRKKTP